MAADELQAFIEGSFPARRTEYRVTEVTDRGVRVRLPVGPGHERPGGTVAGPVLMGLADGTAWAAVLSRVGPVALAVTTSLHIDFLRRPALADLEAEGVLLKLGRRLAVVEVTIATAGRPEPVAQAQVTYSLPPA
jgi:uncharacterized protein (TIGR00369 family)